MIWLVFAFLTGVALLAVLWPLLRSPRTVPRKDADVAFYEAQIVEIGRDAERGLIAAADAASAKAEAARRLIAAGDQELVVPSPKPGSVDAGAKLRSLRRAIAAGIAIVFVPVIAFGLYRIVGNPDLPDLPLTARLNAAPDDMDVAAAVAKIEVHLAQHPDDGKGWEVIAPIYLNLGRGDDAVTAYANALRLLGTTSDRLEAYGRALVFAAGDKVTPQAVETFKAALAEEPGLPEARFFLGVAAEQSGDKAGAVDIWTKLLADAPPDAEWADFVRKKIADDGGNPPLSPSSPADRAATADDRLAPPPAGAAAAVAAMPADDQQKFIRNMVDSLAERLHQDGHDVEGWLRLVRAYNVLQEPDKARAALVDARKSLGDDTAALARIDQLARELGLEG